MLTGINNCRPPNAGARASLSSPSLNPTTAPSCTFPCAPRPKHGVAVSDLQPAGKWYVAMAFFIFPFHDPPGYDADEGIARDLTIDAAQAARSSRSTQKSLSTAQIRKLLDSRNEREILDGLRKVITVCAPCSSFRPGAKSNRVKRVCFLSQEATIWHILILFS